MLGHTLTASLLAGSMIGGPVMTVEAKSLCAAEIRSIDASAATTIAQGSQGMVVVIAHRGRPVFLKGYGLTISSMTRPSPARRSSGWRR